MASDPTLFYITDHEQNNYQIVTYENIFKKDLRHFYKMFEPKGQFLGLPPVNKADLNVWLERIIKEWQNYLILSNKTVIGHIALDIFHDPQAPELMIFIQQGYRYRGIGTNALAGLKDLLAGRERKQIWLIVQNSNVAAVRCFQKVGFRFIGPIASEREMVCPLKGI